VPRLERDRYFAPDIEAVRALIISGALRKYVAPELLDNGSAGAG